jgi:hypothetical protein
VKWRSGNNASRKDKLGGLLCKQEHPTRSSLSVVEQFARSCGQTTWVSTKIHSTATKFGRSMRVMSHEP